MGVEANLKVSGLSNWKNSIAEMGKAAACHECGLRDHK
jgi:hypothetical protein